MATAESEVGRHAQEESESHSFGQHTNQSYLIRYINSGQAITDNCTIRSTLANGNVREEVGTRENNDEEEQVISNSGTKLNTVIDEKLGVGKYREKE